MLAGVVMDAVRDLSGAATGSLVAAVWQGALLAGAAGLGLKLLPKTPAAVRFAVWFSVFVVVAALPFASLWAHPVATGVAASHAPWFTVSARWSEAVLALWLAVSLVRAVMLVVAAVRVRALWERATLIEIAAGHRGEDLLGRTIQVCTSDEVDRPSVIGFFAPRILIPSWLLEKLTPEEMAHVVLHEAGHLRRADDWLNLLQKIALVVFPLNPALAWVERRLCFERELACDEQVLQATGAPKAYASCLASLAEHRMTRRGMALVMGALGRESDLGQRVLRILARGEQMRPGQARLVMGGAVCALLAGAAGLEHCPQLIRFSGGHELLTTSAPVAATTQYRDVVYRTNAASTMPVRAVNTVLREPIAAAARGKQVPGSAEPDSGSHESVGSEQSSSSAVALHRVNALARRHVNVTSSLAGPQEPAQGVVATQWVVMTSWTADSVDGGARIVMTSIATGPAQQPSPKATAPAREEAGGAQDATPVRVVPAVQMLPNLRQSSPYAAVPFRGGWLVIQL